VAGTESSTSSEFVVQGNSTDFTVQAIPPAGLNSPFGLLPTAAALAKHDPITGAPACTLLTSP
jgi:hypothetical protein